MLEIFAFVVLVAVSFGLMMRLGLNQYELAPKPATVVREFPSAQPAQELAGIQRFDHWFGRMVRLSRFPLAPAQVSMLIVGVASVVAAALFVATEKVGPAIMLGILLVVASVLGIAVAYQRMLSKFEVQLPMALELMARAVTAGESLEQAISLVAGSMEEPAKTEFRRCHNQLQMGLSIRAAMSSLIQRIDTTNVRVMASILSVHRESGGNLADTLTRLAEVIRNRFDYERKLKTVTGAGRASVIVVAGLAWCIFGYLFLCRPEYGRPLWENPSGRSMLVLAATLECIGMVWGWSLLRKRM